MKNLKLLIAGIGLLFINASYAQVNVNVNLGTAPNWGPAGYTEAEYYYIPDVESYYDVRQKQFIYYGNGQWVRATRLPVQYRGYDLYNGYKVVLTDYHGQRPYDNYNVHKVKYFKGYHGAPQKSIGVKPVHKNNGKGHGGPGKGHGDHGNHSNGKGKH